MSMKTRKYLEAFSKAVWASLRADGENSRAGLFYGKGASGTEVLRYTASLITSLVPVNFSGGVRRSVVNIGDVATYQVLAANSGKLHVIPDLTADCIITLPAVADGLEYEFIYGGVAADAQDWLIKTGSDVNFFLGGVLHHDTDAGAGTDELVVVYPDGNSNSMFDFDTPQAGTSIKMYCDGTNWFINGTAAGVSAPTFADNA